MIYCHSLKKIFLEQNLKVPPLSLLSLRMLWLVALYVKPVDVVDVGGRNCVLFECIYTKPKTGEKSCILHPAKCQAQDVTSNFPFLPTGIKVLTTRCIVIYYFP